MDVISVGGGGGGGAASNPAATLTAQLKAELEHQWRVAHADHCDSVWPHPRGVECRWPRPPILDVDIQNSAYVIVRQVG